MKNKSKRMIKVFNIVIGFMLLPFVAISQTIELKNNFFYIDGQKFFVKGIGYELGALPGEVPWEKTYNPDQIHFDIQRILSGGYNTIRTWAPFTRQELEVLSQYDIKIIMGIWIDPHGDFADEAFVNNARSIVENVLSYSKNYNNIIAYLIMNEPLPETVAGAGYNATVSLWQELIDIIHIQHPGHPVSISNTSNGTYIDSDIFDFSAYNAYIYNPVTVNYLHQYQDFVYYLGQLNKSGGPLIITEYGLSVSPSGEGNWGYGGNSDQQQEEGDIYMYKALVNGGAAGSCIFNYSDGWWKAGNEYVHDDAAEEWFGLVEYADLSDNEGVVRQAWNAIHDFQSAIITEPKSSGIYNPVVPLEIFASDTIKRTEVVLDDEVIYQIDFESDYYLGELIIDTQEILDVHLVFNCYNEDHNLIKQESKSILIAPSGVSMPTIDVGIVNDDPWQDGYVEVDYQLEKSTEFQIGSSMDYIFYPHVGFNYGDSYQKVVTSGNSMSFGATHYFNNSVDVITVGAAVDISYQSFEKRIVNQQTISRINNIPSSIGTEKYSVNDVMIYPNPASDNVYISNAGKNSMNYKLFDGMGKLVMMGKGAVSGTRISLTGLPAGIYFLQVTSLSDMHQTMHKVIKL
ncbi:T9SS type A sorting domain-containing protein [Labilibacter sediminis]|nr:T9SS type A sorting domain-containing protein [Labilibacter sediminis]